MKLLSEVIPESQSPNLPSQSANYQFDLRENLTSLSLVLDVMFDYGVPNIVEKSTLVSLLEKGQYSRTTDMLTGDLSSAHERVCSQLSNQIEQLP